MDNQSSMHSFEFDRENHVYDILAELEDQENYTILCKILDRWKSRLQPKQQKKQ